MLHCLPAELRFKVALFLSDCVDLLHFFCSLNLVKDAAELKCEDAGPFLLSPCLLQWFTVLDKGKAQVALPLQLSEDAINTEVWRTQNQQAILLAPRIRSVTDPIEETNVFQRVLQRHLAFARCLLAAAAGKPLVLELTILGAERSTRLTFRMLREFLRAIAPQLTRLKIITRTSTLPIRPRDDTPPPRGLVPADGVYTPPPPVYHVWNDKSHQWSPAGGSSQIWSDAESWDALPDMPVLRHLHISGPASMVWVGALRWIVTKSLEELVIQCWLADGFEPKDHAEALRDFLTNTCIAKLERLGIVVPPRFEILTPLLLRTVLRICHATMKEVAFVHHGFNRHHFARLFPCVSQGGASSILDAAALARAPPVHELSMEQRYCLTTVQEHLRTVASILKDRSLRDERELLGPSVINFHWLEFGDWPGKPFSLRPQEPSRRPKQPRKPTSCVASVLRELNDLIKGAN